MTITTADAIKVFWHRELPPLSAETIGQHFVEARSKHVKGDLGHRTELWDECYDDLMATARTRLEQEIARLGGDYAHVMEEFIDSRRDDAAGEAWLQGRFSYMLLKRSAG